MNRRLRIVVGLTLFTLAALAAGCGHKQPPPAPPAPPPAAAPTPPPPAPTVTLSADPASIERGERSTLSWTSNNAATVELNGARVNLSGTQAVTPTQSTDYQITARSADGRAANASAHVTVTVPPPPPPPPPPPAPPAPSVEELFHQQVRDAFFDFDKYNIRTDAQQALLADAEFFKSHPDVKIVVEGHCDDRGSAQYNLALGDRRANAVKTFLQQQGVDPSRISTVSYGKERPYCTDSTEDCYQQNRRGALTLAH